MKSAFLITIVFAVCTLLSVQNTKAASTDTPFDGIWSVTVDVKLYENPDGSKAQPFVWRFPATVKNGVFHGEIGTRGKPGWYQRYTGGYRQRAVPETFDSRFLEPPWRTLFRSDHQAFSGRFDHILRHLGQIVNPHDALHLGQ